MSICISLVFIVAALLLALFLEALVSIFGLFASLAGFFYYFFVPFYCYIVLDKLREANKHLDIVGNVNGAPVDNVSTAVLTLATGNLQTARRLSEKMFG